MAEAPLIKPISERGGLAILGPWSNIALMDPETGEIIEHGTVTGTNQNGRANTVRFSKPGPQYGTAIIVDMSTGEQISDPVNLSNRAYGSGNTFKGAAYTPNPGGPGDFSTGRLVNPGGGGGYVSNIGGVDFSVPGFADYSTLNFKDVEFPEIEASTIEGVDPVDIFAVADAAGERNKELITQAFADARGISREIIDESDAANQERLAEINEFNAQQQREAFAELGPNAASILDQGTKNLKAFSEGRLPDALENEILNQSSRALAAQQTNITGGGGVGSTFGNRVANQLSIQQRIGLQESAINSAPSFLANALELRRGTPQRLQFDPNQEINVRSGVAGTLAEGQTLTPGQAIQSEFQNVANELNTQQFNANVENTTNQFNASGIFQADQINSQADLQVQLQKLAAEQFQYNTIASLENSAFNAIRANQQEQQNIDAFNTGVDQAQESGTISAIATGATAVFGIMGALGLGKGVINKVKEVLGVKDDGTVSDSGITVDNLGRVIHTGKDFTPNMAQALSDIGSTILPNGVAIQYSNEYKELVKIANRFAKDGGISKNEMQAFMEVSRKVEEMLAEAAQAEINSVTDPGGQGNAGFIQPEDRPDSGGIFDENVPTVPGAGGGDSVGVPQ